MLLTWLNKFRGSNSPDSRTRYTEEALRPRLEIAAATPVKIEPIPDRGDAVRLHIDFGRGRLFWVTYYDCQKKRQPAREHAALVQSLAQRDLPVPELVFADYSEETRKAYGLEVVVEKAVERAPFDQPWTHAHLTDLARMLRRIHSVSHETCGAPWRADAPPMNLVREYAARWTRALRTVEEHIGRQVEPNREAAFREKSAARMESSRYELVHGALRTETIGRLKAGGAIPLTFEVFHFGLRETDLLAVAQNICLGAPEKVVYFVARYLEGASDGVRRRHDALRPYFLALHCLEKGAWLAKSKDEKSAAACNGEKQKGKPKAGVVRTRAKVPDEEVLRQWEAFLKAGDLIELYKPKVARKAAR